MAGLWTRPRVRSVTATSSTFESRPYCAAITSYPSACSGGMTLLKHEPSAQIPWRMGRHDRARAPPTGNENIHQDLTLPRSAATRRAPPAASHTRIKAISDDVE